MRSWIIWEIIAGLRQVLTPRDKWCLLGLVVLLCIGAAMEIAGLGLLLPLVAMFTKPELFEQNSALRLFRSLFAGAGEKEFLLICCGAVALVYTLKNVWLFVIMRSYTAFTCGRLGAISCRLYSKLLAARYDYFALRGKVEYLTLVNKVDQMGGLVLLPFMLMTVDLLTIFFIMLMLLLTIPGVVLGCSLVFGIGTALFHFPVKRLSFKTGEALNNIYSRINKICLYSFEDIKSVKVMGAEAFFTEKFTAARNKKSSLETTNFVLGQLPRLLLETLAVLSALAVLVFMLLRGEAVGTVILSFSLLVAAMSRLLPAFSRINYAANALRIGYAVFKDIIDASNWESELPGDELTPFEFKESIVVKDLSFSYPDSGTVVIRNLNFELKRNGSLAVVGPTGGGKSTLIDLLLGIRLPDSGAILADGRDIAGSLKAWRKIIGFVPQHIVLCDDTIAANVALGCKTEEIDYNRVWEVLRIAQMESFVNTLPEKLETMIGDNGLRLSGGQRQRLGIARALYRDPEIIIFDEATSALDTETEQALIDALDGLYGEKTLIMVAHRLSTIEKCEQRIEINAAAKDS